MAHQLEKFYAAFGGVDTRSNKLAMKPSTFRNGSKNFRYNFQDEIQKANGFQYRDDGSAACAAGAIEYKYTDINTGQSKTELLGVATDGILRRKKAHYIKFTAIGAATGYSMYYDEVSDLFKFDVLGVGSVAISLTMTMTQLSTALNLLAGITTVVVDDAGTTVTSTKLAYLGECVISGKLLVNSLVNSSWFWENVPYPDTNYAGTYASVPFPTTVSFFGLTGYEGISYSNLNNVCYITDGGFPMKYDGKAVYRAGMPSFINAWTSYSSSGTTISGTNATATIPPDASIVGIPNGNYFYKYRYAFTDVNGSTYYGKIFTPSNAPSITAIPIPGLTMVTYIQNRGIYNGKDFPVFAAKVNGLQVTGTAGGPVTLTVFSGHNIKVGMCVRQLTRMGNGASIPSAQTTNNSLINFNAVVTAITDTTITLQATVDTQAVTLLYSSSFLDGDILNAYYTQDLYANKRPFNYYSDTKIQPIGAFLQIFRTKINQDPKLGIYYHVYDMPMPYKQGDVASVYDNKADTDLIQELVDTEGDDLPRACKYLQTWQNQLVQAGRPVDPTIQNTTYPSFFLAVNTPQFSQSAIETISKYTEAGLCDYQSFYWASSLAPEGFPQSGLNEQRVDTVFNDQITGLYPNKGSLFAFKQRSTSLNTGTLATGDINSETLEGDTGCTGQRTIQEIDGTLIWLDSNKGFYSCVAGRLPVHIGFTIDDYQKINSQGLDYTKAVSANLRDQDLYFCFVGSTWFVLDYSETASGSNRNCWYIWERFPVTSAIASANGGLLAFDSTRTWAAKFTNTRYDFTDHNAAIEMNAKIAWQNFGLPTVDKNFERFWINSIQGGFSLDVDQYGNYLEALISSINVKFKDATILPTKLTVKEWIKAAIPKLSAISIGFRNAEKNTFVRIQGFEIEYSPDYDSGEPKR